MNIAQLLDRYLRRHQWTVYHGSQLSFARALRVCNCGARETLMYDHSKGKMVWVPGNFLEDINSPVFIVAQTHEEMRRILHQVPLKDPYFQVKSVSDLLLMKKYHCPRFVLARDWKETDISDTEDFARLMVLRHF